MENQMRSKVIRIGMIDHKLALPLYCDLDLNNIMSTIRKARIDYAQFFMANGPFRRQPTISIIFELPDGGWRYVRSWIRNADNSLKILELSKEIMDEPQKLICEVLRTWNECEKVWAQHIEEIIREFEQTLPSLEMDVPRILQFSRK